MQQSIRILCDIYNFIAADQHSPASINLQPIEEFRQIFLLIGEFVNNDCIDPRGIFEELSQFIHKEEEVFGPRKFRKMIESVSTIMVEFVAGRLREGATELAVLTLTYYHRHCHRYFTLPIRMLLVLLHALAHFRKNTIDIAQNYISQAKQLLKALEKEGEGIFAAQTNVVLELLQGMACLRRENFIRAKYIFSETINHLTQRIHNEQKRKKLTTQTASFFTVATYFLGEAYKGLGQHDRAAYHTTQCLEFASAHLPHHQALSFHLASTHQLATTSVKLGRTENKIERIKSLHHFISRPLRPNTKENTRAHQFKINKRVKEVKEMEARVKGELQNILILDQGSEARLKKKTLKQLQVEKQEKQRKIQLFQQQIIEFRQEKQAIALKYPNEHHHSQIEHKKVEMQAIKGEISSKIWEVVGTLKPTLRIQAYLTGFACAITYEKTNNFIKFLYNQVSFSSHLRLYSILRKVRSKLVRQAIRQVKIGSVLHQIELSRHKVAGTFHMKVYQIEKGIGVNQEQEVSSSVYQSLKTESFYYSFQVQQGRIVTLKEYLNSLGKCLLTRVRLFFLKLHKRVQMKRKQMVLCKKEVIISFGTEYNQLKYLMFIISRGNTDGSFTHTIQRIDTTQHYNADYNIHFCQTVTTKSLELSNESLSQLVTESMLQDKAKHARLITQIQQMFRLKLAKRELVRLKEHTQVMTTIIGNTIYSLILTPTTRTFFIENLQKKYPKVRIPSANFFNLSFLHKIRAELMACEECGDQVEAINKYFRLRNFAYKFIKKSQQVKLDTKFSTKFKKSLCFAKVMKQYLYRGKLIEGRMMYMLTVKNFEAFPRPYLLRVFTVEHKSLYCVDCELLIYNTEKIYLQHNLQRINHFLDIQDHRRVTILDGPYNPNPKLKRQNSKSTLINNYSFGPGEEFLRERGSRLAGRLTHQRDSNLNPNPNRNKKNSINFKMRHKSALKQKDILLIKKWIEDSKEDSSISQSQESSAA